MPLILALMLECQVLRHYKCFQPKIMERMGKKYNQDEMQEQSYAMMAITSPGIPDGRAFVSDRTW